MARLRTIDQTTVLDAAERVIIENGAANFTLDAVAARAGISKGSVLRDYGHKQDLIRAIVRRRFDEYREALDVAEQQKSSRIAAHLEVSGQPWPDEQRKAASNLCSSLTNDSELVAILSQHYDREIAAISSAGAGSGALLAFLAIEGLKSIEMVCGYNWPPADREALLASISRLSTADQSDAV